MFDMITREKKENMVQELKARFQKSKASFLVDFKGMKVEQVTNLRKKLYPSQGEMKVVRNTLAKRALSGLYPEDGPVLKNLQGSNAFVFAYEDPAKVAKVLTEFSKDVEFLQLKCGILEGRDLEQPQIQALASLPSLEVLRAQLLGVMQAPASQLARTLKEVSAQLVRVLNAKTQKES
jgi:large subunit ribosomal protein L10